MLYISTLVADFKKNKFFFTMNLHFQRKISLKTN